MDLAAVGAASIDMHMAQTQQAVSIAVLKKAMNLDAVLSGAIVEDLQAANPAPAFGRMLDVLA